MTRSSASLRISVLLLACLAACGGDDGDDDVTAPAHLSTDAGADGTTPGNTFEASVEDSTVADTGSDGEGEDGSADGAVAEGGNEAGVDGSVAEAGVDGSVPEAGVDSGVPEAGVDSGVPEAGVDSGVPEAGVDSGIADARADVATAEASTDAGKDASLADAAVDAGVTTCTVTNSAPAVTMGVNPSSVLPTQSGGTFVTGTYYLTAYTWYGGPAGCAGASIQWTLAVTASSTTAGTLSEISQAPGSSTGPSCSNDTPYSTSGANLDGAGSGTTYTATATTITLATVDSGQCGSVLTVFTKH